VYPLVPFVALAGAFALIAVLGRWPDALQFIEENAHAARFACAALLIATVWQPAWAGAVAFTRRVTRPTHMQWSIGCRSTRLGHRRDPGNAWLDPSESPTLEIRRVADLQVALDGGVEQLAATGADWIVVPEPWFGHPTLKRLGFLQRFHASRTFGGSEGYDYEIYAIPRK
jgi:hypothetical protein